jgi:hypothetical protein
MAEVKAVERRTEQPEVVDRARDFGGSMAESSLRH